MIFEVSVSIMFSSSIKDSPAAHGGTALEVGLLTKMYANQGPRSIGSAHLGV